MTFNQQKSKKVVFHQQHATISTNSYNYCTNTNRNNPTTKSAKFRINRFVEIHFKPYLHTLEFKRRTSILQQVIGNSCGAMYNVIDIKRELLVSTQYQPLGITLDRALDQFKARKRAPEHAAKYEEQEWSMANTRQLRRSYGDYNDKNRFHGDYNNGGDNSGNSRDRFESCDSGTGSGTGSGGHKDKPHSGYYIDRGDYRDSRRGRKDKRYYDDHRDRIDNGGGRRGYMSRGGHKDKRESADYINGGSYTDRRHYSDNDKRDYGDDDKDRVDNGSSRRDYIGSSRRDYIGSSRRDYIGSDTRDKHKGKIRSHSRSRSRSRSRGRGRGRTRSNGNKTEITLVVISKGLSSMNKECIKSLFGEYGRVVN
eukprot:459569_1